MLQAIAAMQIQPDYLLVDGLKLAHPTIPSEKIINGDQLSHSIAAASIIAKETRDRMMTKSMKVATLWFLRNKVMEHQSIKSFRDSWSLSDHRRSFAL